MESRTGKVRWDQNLRAVDAVPGVEVLLCT